jgi:hypothetical protein
MLRMSDGVLEAILRPTFVAVLGFLRSGAVLAKMTFAYEWSMPVRVALTIRHTAAVVASQGQWKYSQRGNERAHHVGVPFLGQSRACMSVSTTWPDPTARRRLPGETGRRNCSSLDPWFWDCRIKSVALRQLTLANRPATAPAVRATVVQLDLLDDVCACCRLSFEEVCSEVEDRS